MYFYTSLKQAALDIRNQGRQAADDNQSNQRRVGKAKDIVKVIQAGGLLRAFGSVALVDLEGSNGETYALTLSDQGVCYCPCKDAEKGNLCKHRLALAAAVILAVRDQGTVQ